MKVECKLALPTNLAPASKKSMKKEWNPKRIFIGGVSQKLTEADLWEYFCQFGDIEDCVILKHEDTNKYRGFAFVTYKSIQATHQLFALGRYHTIKEAVVDCKYAFPKSEESEIEEQEESQRSKMEDAITFAEQQMRSRVLPSHQQKQPQKLLVQPIRPASSLEISCFRIKNVFPESYEEIEIPEFRTPPPGHLFSLQEQSLWSNPDKGRLPFATSQVDEFDKQSNKRVIENAQSGRRGNSINLSELLENDEQFEPVQGFNESESEQSDDEIDCYYRAIEDDTKGNCLLLFSEKVKELKLFSSEILVAKEIAPQGKASNVSTTSSSNGSIIRDFVFKSQGNQGSENHGWTPFT